MPAAVRARFLGVAPHERSEAAADRCSRPWNLAFGDMDSPSANAKLRIMSTPGLVIDGKVVSYGGIPSAGDIALWLSE